MCYFYEIGVHRLGFQRFVHLEKREWQDRLDLKNELNRTARVARESFEFGFRVLIVLFGSVVILNKNHLLRWRKCFLR